MLVRQCVRLTASVPQLRIGNVMPTNVDMTVAEAEGAPAVTHTRLSSTTVAADPEMVVLSAAKAGLFQLDPCRPLPARARVSIWRTPPMRTGTHVTVRSMIPGADGADAVDGDDGVLVGLSPETAARRTTSRSSWRWASARRAGDGSGDPKYTYTSMFIPSTEAWS